MRICPVYSYLYLLLLSWKGGCWRTLKYATIAEFDPVSLIPDQKWHFFEICPDDGEHFAADLTPNAPVLRYCVIDEVFRVYITKGQPSFELLVLLRHANGEHLINLTVNDDDVYFNNKFLFKCIHWLVPDNRTELYIRTDKRGFLLWADAELHGLIEIGNGPNKNPKYEWLYVTVNNRRCYEAKAKVVVGNVRFTILRRWTGWPLEDYDDTFFETTTTTTTTVAITTTNVPEENDEYQGGETTSSSTVNKASTMLGLIYAACGILVLIAAAMLFFLGFRFGRCFARKRALKTGLLKSGVKESNASEPGSDTGAITPDASNNQAETSTMPTKAMASIPTTKTNTEKNPVHAKSDKPRTPITPTTKDEVEASAVPTEPLLISKTSNRTV